jgi:cytidylate kinase
LFLINKVEDIMRNLQIAVDGPAGSGKSTVAKEIANRLGIIYLDTGAMYRAVTYLALEPQMDVKKSQDLRTIVDSLTLEMEPGRIFVNGQDVTESIRLPEVSRNVSYTAMDAYVRERMVALQRSIAGNKSVIMDGRDIGTHVLPDAKYKFFLTATAEERAERRMKELHEKGFDVSFEQLVNEIKERDRLDSEREVSPLVKAEDAIEIDTTSMGIQDVVRFILDFVEDN